MPTPKMTGVATSATAFKIHLALLSPNSAARPRRA